MVRGSTSDTHDSTDAGPGTRRRTFLKLAGGAGSAGLVAGCVGGLGGGGGGNGGQNDSGNGSDSGASGSTPTLNILTWEEYTELKEEIESRLDVKVKFTKSTSSAKMFSSWNAGQYKQYDIAIPNNNYVPRFMSADLIDSVPSDVVSNQKNIYDTFQQFSENQFTKEGDKYGVPIRFGWYGYSYDSREIPDHEESYGILFNPEFEGTDLKGKIIMYDNHFKAMSATALHLGYKDPFQQGSTVKLSEKQLKKVKETMMEQKSLLQGYIAADPTYIKSFNQGNFLVGQSGRNEIIEMQTNGNDWATMATPKEGSLAWFESAVVSKDSSNKEMAWKVINQFIAPKLGAKLAEAGYSPSVNPKTQEHLSKEQNDLYGAIKPEKLEQFIPFKTAENEEEWIKAWEDIKSA